MGWDSYLLHGADEDGKAAADNKFDKAQQGGAVNVDDEVYDCLHNSQREDESGSGACGTVRMKREA